MRTAILFDNDLPILLNSIDKVLTKYLMRPKDKLIFAECGIGTGGTTDILINYITEKQLKYKFNFDYYGIDTGDYAARANVPLEDFKPKGFHFVKGLSFQVADQVPDGIDWLFIDACHCHYCVARDANTYIPKLSKIGIVAFHDASPLFQGQYPQVHYPSLNDHHDHTIAREGIQVVKALQSLNLNKLSIALLLKSPMQKQGGVQLYQKTTIIKML